MTVPQTPTPVPKEIRRQLVLVSIAEALLMLGIALFFIVEPQTTVTIVLAALASAVGLVGAVYAIYRAVPLMSEPTTRMVGYLSVALIVTGPILLFAIVQFI